jgi:uncharacterized protein (DUF39 family)
MSVGDESNSHPKKQPEETVPLPPGDIDLKKGTFVQRAGLWLATGVGGVIAIVTISLVVFLYIHYPDMPRPVTAKAGAEAAAQYTIEEYKQLSDIAVKSAQDLFQTIVAQVMIPVFTAILGYIFGRGGKEDEE